jgi:hypothetical protein
MHAAGDLQTASGDHLFNEGALFWVRPEERSDVAGLVEDELELRIRPHRRQGPQGKGGCIALNPSETVHEFSEPYGGSRPVQVEIRGLFCSRAIMLAGRRSIDVSISSSISVCTSLGARAPVGHHHRRSEISVLLARCSRWFLSAKRCASSRNTCNRRRLAEVLGRSHPRAICLHDRTHRTGFIYRQRENRRLPQGEAAYFQMDNSPTI